MSRKFLHFALIVNMYGDYGVKWNRAGKPEYILYIGTTNIKSLQCNNYRMRLFGKRNPSFPELLRMTQPAGAGRHVNHPKE